MTLEYAVRIERLAESDGGGYLATVPDLPGCMSDGETPEEALSREVRDEIGWTVAIVRKIGEATQYVITKSNNHSAIQATYYEARLLQQIGEPEEPGDELLWLVKPQAIALLPRQSDAWAIAQAK